RLLATGVGELEHPLAGVGRRLSDELLVLELLQRRGDGARARAPDPPGALRQLLDDLVAVHRLLREEHEDRGADVATSGPAPEGVRAAAVPSAATVWAAHEVDPHLVGAAVTGVCKCSHAVPFVVSRYIVTHRNRASCVAAATEAHDVSIEASR